ncbi:hypothetical protein WJX73_005260 [Symbiochloris irregularis]|uniref:Uncharacterized protein n=1 Tax=Symbiochloris irregularis TaxID=706552 RepID=A0AAW1NMZ0_9CHLO
MLAGQWHQSEASLPMGWFECLKVSPNCTMVATSRRVGWQARALQVHEMGSFREIVSQLYVEVFAMNNGLPAAPY